jgi:CDP-ribitol ribitolphosphotransferase
MAEINTGSSSLILPWCQQTTAFSGGVHRSVARRGRVASAGRRYDRGVVDPLQRSAAAEANGFEVVGVRWERIQLVLTIRSPAGALSEADAGQEFLLRADATGAQLRARPGLQAGDIWLNVFAGADRMPVPPGRWRLMTRAVEGGRPGSVSCAAELLASAAADREFVHPTWTFQVTPRSASGTFEVLVDVRRTAGAARVRTIGGLWQRFQRAVRVGGFRATVALVRLLPRGKRQVVFTSDSRAELGGNLAIVHDRMVERGLDQRMQLRTILKPSVRANRSMVDRLRLPWLLARADVILLDDYQPVISQLRPHPDVRIIQLWHAWGAFKTVGYSRIGKPGGPNPFSRVHKNYTYATVSSAHVVPFYAEAFGLPETSVVATGTPRMDEFLDPANQEAGRERAFAANPGARDRRVILFAPTFRGDKAALATYPAEVLDLPALHALAEEIDAVVILKMHPFVAEPVLIPPPLADRLIDAGASATDVNDLLLIADILVTDYSSLIFEYASLGRPMLFFVFDLDEYVAGRDFYEPFEAFAPGRIVRTFPQLLDAIRRGDFEQHKVAPFAKRHLPTDPGSATDRIIDQLILPQ